MKHYLLQMFLQQWQQIQQMQPSAAATSNLPEAAATPNMPGESNITDTLGAADTSNTPAPETP